MNTSIDISSMLCSTNCMFFCVFSSPLLQKGNGVTPVSHHAQSSISRFMKLKTYQIPYTTRLLHERNSFFFAG